MSEPIPTDLIDMTSKFLPSIGTRLINHARYLINEEEVAKIKEREKISNKIIQDILEIIKDPNNFELSLSCKYWIHQYVIPDKLSKKIVDPEYPDIINYRLINPKNIYNMNLLIDKLKDSFTLEFYWRGCIFTDLVINILVPII
jgi:hypothetical protein